MLAVVIDRIRGEPTALAQAAAAALNKTPYDLRASVQVPQGGPAVVDVHAEPEAAQAAAQRLRQAGFDTAVVEVASLQAEVGDFDVRQFELGPDRLELSTRDGRNAVIEYAQVRLLVRASRTVTTTRTETTKKRQFSLGRSLATGGLINTRTVESKRTAKQLDAEEVLFVFVDDQAPAMLRETELVYQSLGPAMQPARAANFAYLADALRKRCTGAVWDERLRRRAAQTQLLGHALSPDDHFDFAVALVAQHHRS